MTAFDGVDDTGGRGDLDSKGGKAWILHPREQVLSLKDRQEVRDPKTGKLRNREELKEIIKMHDNPTNFLNPSAFVLNGMDNVRSGISTAAIETGLATLNNSINNIKIPEGTVSIDEVKNLISLRIKTGNNVKTEVSKLRG